MNIYSYFREPAENLNVPGKNEALWNWIVAQTKIYNCSPRQQRELLTRYHALLQNDEDLNAEAIRGEVRAIVGKNVKTASFWKAELGDLFSFLFVYWVMVEQVWPYVGARFLAHQPMIGTLPLTWGTVLKVVFVYFVLKLVLAFLSLHSRRDTVSFWGGFIGLFLLYLGLIYVANRFSNAGIVEYPLLGAVVVCGALFCFEWNAQRHKEK